MAQENLFAAVENSPSTIQNDGGAPREAGRGILCRRRATDIGP